MEYIESMRQMGGRASGIQVFSRRAGLDHRRAHSTLAILLGLLLVAGCNSRPDVAGPAETHPVLLTNTVCDLEGRPIDPFGGNAKAVTLLFIRTDCPISNRYAPEMERLRKEFEPRGIRFWLVHPANDESPAAIRKHAEEYQLRSNIIRDPGHVLVQKTQAQVTPEAAVFLDRNRLVYRGRIDDRFVDLGQARPQPTRRDLQDVLSAILAGTPILTNHSPAVGCFIQDLK